MKKIVPFSLCIYIVFQFVVFGLNLSFAQEPDQTSQQDQCVVCHLDLEIMPENFHEKDSHVQAGLSCAGCHGGDPKAEDMEEGMDPENGYIGVPTRSETPQFCGKCHSSIDYMRTFQPRIATDQVAQYYTSVHGQQLKAGDDKVAECISCHTSHAIMPTRDPRSSVYPVNVPETCGKCHSDEEYMAPYGIVTDQQDKYTKSIHGELLFEKHDIGAPVCNDCHGNHGARPPGVASVSHVCGSCHVNNMNYFSSSKMGEAFEDSDLHACEQCHGHHDVKKTTDEMVGVGEFSICMDCHSEGDTGYESAKQIYSFIKLFADTLQVADLKLSEVQKKGMDDVDLLFLLQEAKQDLIHARTLVHNFDSKKVKEKTDEGLLKVDGAILLANEQISDFHTRRRGLGLSIVFIAILAIGLYLKIREIDKRTE